MTRLAVFGAALLLLTACGDPRPMLPALTGDATVLAFGDSLTAGTGAGRDQAYPAVLGSLIGRRVVNAGVPGETTPEGLARLPGQLAEHGPALVILCLGGNDMLRKLSRDDAKANLARMVGMIRDSGAAVLLLGVPEPGLFLLSVADFYNELAAELAVPIEAEALPAILGQRELKSDQIHPNAAGYRQLAVAIREFLVTAGAID